MKAIYRVTIHGVTLESGDLKQLLARAVSEKRSMDQKAQHFWSMQRPPLRGYADLPAAGLLAERA
jgi:hypothetical protein